MRGFVRAVVHARRDRPALRRGIVRVVAADGQAIALAREADGQRALVAINSGRESMRLELEPALLAGLSALELPLVAGGRLIAEGMIDLPPQGALILV